MDGEASRFAPAAAFFVDGASEGNGREAALLAELATLTGWELR